MTFRQASLPVRRVFGRDRDVEVVVAMLDPGAPAFVTITGRGGVGKTALAAEVVRALDDPGCTTWVPLAGVTDADLVVAAIATALGASAQPGTDPTDLVVGGLQHGSHLLVLDNAEHLLAAAPMLGDLFERCQSLRMLVTSQAPLRLQSEQVVALAPLPVPTDADVGREQAAVEQPAIALYCQRAAAVDPAFRLTDRTAPTVAELCRRLEGLPLAIELAAARSAVLPAAAILSRLADAGLEVLQRQRADVPDRHHGLRAAIEWTYGLLGPEERRALRILSATAGTVDLDVAVALIGGADAVDDDLGGPTDQRALDDLASLVDFHLVDPVPGSDPPRFTLPDSIRVFARDALVRQGEADAAERRRIRLRANRARAMAEVIEAGHGETHVPAIEADRDDLTDALNAAIDRGLADDALDIARCLGAHWDLRGYGPVQADVLERVLDLAGRTDCDPVGLANAMLWSAYLGLRHSHGDQDTMIDRIIAAESLGKRCGDDAALFHAQCVWLLVTPLTGDFVRAKEATDEGLRLAERHGNEAWRSTVQVWAGMLATLAGDEERSVELGMAALQGARRAGDHETVVRAAMLLGPIADRFPERVIGMPSTEETIALTRELGLTFYEALLLVRRVHEALRMDDPDTALTWMAETLRMARTMLSSPVVGFDLMAMVGLAHACGHPARAAFFQGTVQESLSVLQLFMSETQLAKHHAVLDSARASLGDGEFDRQVALGAMSGPAEAVDEAIAYVGERPSPWAETAPPTDLAPGSTDALTARQLEVLRCLAAGLSNKEIAAELGLRAKTVMHHTTAIYRALGVRGRSEATAMAFRARLVD